MKKNVLYIAMVGVALFILFAGVRLFVWAGSNYYDADPRRYEPRIQALEQADKSKHPGYGKIVFYGSSSIRRWRSIHADMAPFEVIARGFGGSNLNDALYFADRMVVAYQPGAVVLYEGENDIDARVSPADFAQKFDQFV